MEEINIRLDAFEGPLDLLYHLIEKNEIDIYDIPIASLTEQYLAYLDAAEEVLCEVGFDMNEWLAYITEYRADGMPAVRHTEGYRKAEQPAYRIVAMEYVKQLPFGK